MSPQQLAQDNAQFEKVDSAAAAPTQPPTTRSGSAGSQTYKFVEVEQYLIELDAKLGFAHLPTTS
jgi:hypothetical protein